MPRCLHVPEFINLHMEFFVDKQSVVRKIWGKADTILFVFAGASAGFALNKAVDWLYFTGRLPADPLARLFSTVMYARQIVFLKKKPHIKPLKKLLLYMQLLKTAGEARYPTGLTAMCFLY
jgi:hypothetical protein